MREKHEACKVWLYDYDGVNPPPEALIGSRHLDDTRMTGAGGDLDDHDDGMVADVGGNNGGQQQQLQQPNCDNSSSPNTATSSGYTSLNHQQTTAAANAATGDASASAAAGMDDDDREFWNLMKDPAVSELKMNRAIRRMRAQDEVSLSSGGGLSLNGSSHSDFSPRHRQRKDDVDFTVTSLGCFLDLLYEKVELMASNSLTTNLLVTSIISQLAAFPQPVLRSVLLLPDVVFQPSVRGLFTAVASLKQKLDNIMPTLAHSEEAVVLARRYLRDRLEEKQQQQQQRAIAFRKTRRDSNSVTSALSQIGKRNLFYITLIDVLKHLYSL